MISIFFILIAFKTKIKDSIAFYIPVKGESIV